MQTALSKTFSPRGVPFGVFDGQTFLLNFALFTLYITVDLTVFCKNSAKLSKKAFSSKPPQGPPWCCLRLKFCVVLFACVYIFCIFSSSVKDDLHSRPDF